LRPNRRYRRGRRRLRRPPGELDAARARAIYGTSQNEAGTPGVFEEVER
jgi:hypothetical protein